VAAGELSVDCDVREDGHTVFVDGELDLATSPELVTTVTRLLAQRAPSITVDLDGVTFIDSAGVHGIQLVRDLCRTHGCVLAITPGQRQVQRVFEVAGINHVLPFRDSSAGI
jgi:anti-sigma B factor antagonist